MSDRRLVPIRIILDTFVEMLADTTDEDARFFLNESSHCIDNELRAELERNPPGACTTCMRTVVEVRPQDHRANEEEWREGEARRQEAIAKAIADHKAGRRLVALRDVPDDSDIEDPPPAF